MTDESDNVGDINIITTEPDSSKTRSEQDLEASSGGNDKSSSSDVAAPIDAENQTLKGLHEKFKKQKLFQNKIVTNSHPLKKLLKLSYYSSCQMPDCNCHGLLVPVIVKTKDGVPVPLSCGQFSDPCSTCNHIRAQHVTHLYPVLIDELNRLVNLVFHMEKIYIWMQREADPETRYILKYIYKLFRKCIITRTRPRINGPLSPPPFEQPTIAMAMSKFIVNKANTLPRQEWQTTRQLAIIFQYNLNICNIATPSDWKQEATSAEEMLTYQKNYARWLMFCRVPEMYESLPEYKVTAVFGRTMLRAIFKSVSSSLSLHTEMMTHVKSPDIQNEMPKFLASLEEEVFNDNSSMWTTDK